MQLLNFSPFPNLRFYNTDQTGAEFGIFVVKGTFEVDDGDNLRIAHEQAPILLTDRYHGEVNRSSLMIPSDLVPRKQSGDLILNAIARSPTNGPETAWRCRIKLVGQHTIDQEIKVTGPRHWLRPPSSSLAQLAFGARSQMTPVDRSGWRLSEPTATREVPIRYELAYGGQSTSGHDGKQHTCVYEHNPIGRGWMDPGTDIRADAVLPAPQIELVNEPITDANYAYGPAGLGPIAPAWLPRRPLGGTFDENWMESGWPNWPKDYSFAYHNSANPRLIYPHYFCGDEILLIEGIFANIRRKVIILSGDRVRLMRASRDGAIHHEPMHLDTLFLDLASADPKDHRVFMSWRASFDVEDTVGAAFHHDRSNVAERAQRQAEWMQHVH